VDDLDISGAGHIGSGEFEGSEHGSLLHSLGDISSPTSYLSSIPSPIGDVAVGLEAAPDSEKVFNDFPDPTRATTQSLTLDHDVAGRKHPFSHILRRVQKTPKETLHDETATASIDDMSRSLPSGIADYCLLIGRPIFTFPHQFS
jgi:hypothetical protein